MLFNKTMGKQIVKNSTLTKKYAHNRHTYIHESTSIYYVYTNWEHNYNRYKMHIILQNNQREHKDLTFFILNSLYISVNNILTSLLLSLCWASALSLPSLALLRIRCLFLANCCSGVIISSGISSNGNDASLLCKIWRIHE